MEKKDDPGPAGPFKLCERERPRVHKNKQCHAKSSKNKAFVHTRTTYAHRQGNGARFGCTLRAGACMHVQIKRDQPRLMVLDDRAVAVDE